MSWVDAPIPGRLAVMRCPRGGDRLQHEVAALRATGIEVVVSLITPGEALELGLQDEDEHCQALGIEFLSLPIYDAGVPLFDERSVSFVQGLARRLCDGKRLAVHCQMGIGRAPTIAAGVLVVLGMAPDQAFAAIGRARGRPVPERASQRRWVEWLAGRASRDARSCPGRDGEE